MPESLKALYERLTPEREPYWARARDFASLTVPSLFPELGHTAHTDFVDPFQSVGAAGLASMTSKLMVALFPPGLRFFAIDLAPSVKRSAEDSGQLGDYERQRDEREAIIQYAVEQASFRVRMSEAIKLLLVSGTCAVQRTKDASWRIWRLPQFVAEVDGEDRLLSLVTLEKISAKALPEKVRAIPDLAARIKKKGDEPLELLTGYVWDGSRFQSHQEVEEVRVPDTDATYSRRTLPVHVARFEPICGESYGRAFIERVYGDLASLEGLQQSIVEIGAESARCLFGVKPNSVARPSDLEGKPNGAFVTMNEGDVFTVKVDKLSDLQVVTAITRDLRADIQGQLGMRMAVQRDAERVTAHEVAMMAQELDSTLGGTYSALSEELQLPILRMVEAELVRSGELTNPAGDPIRTRVIAGLEGLGRQIEFNSVTRFLAAAAGVPEEAVHGYAIDAHKVLTRLAKAAGIDPNEFLRTAEQAAQRRQQAAQAAQQQALAPEIARQGGQIIQSAMNGR